MRFCFGISPSSATYCSVRTCVMLDFVISEDVHDIRRACFYVMSDKYAWRRCRTYANWLEHCHLISEGWQWTSNLLPSELSCQCQWAVYRDAGHQPTRLVCWVDVWQRPDADDGRFFSHSPSFGHLWQSVLQCQYELSSTPVHHSLQGETHSTSKAVIGQRRQRLPRGYFWSLVRHDDFSIMKLIVVHQWNRWAKVGVKCQERGIFAPCISCLLPWCLSHPSSSPTSEGVHEFPAGNLITARPNGYRSWRPKSKPRRSCEWLLITGNPARNTYNAITCIREAQSSFTRISRSYLDH